MSSGEDYPDDEKSSSVVTPTTSNNNSSSLQKKKSYGAALVFGAAGAQGRAVVVGLLEKGYFPVYGATRDLKSSGAVEVSNLGGTLLEVNVGDADDVEKALLETKAQAIFLVTTTDMPPNSISFKRAEQKECETIMSFFDTLVVVHKKDGLDRHVVFSTLDNVEKIVKDNATDENLEIEPLDDGTIVCHYSGKGRGGEYGLEITKKIHGITVTLVTLPYLHSNFHGFTTPLANEGQTEWTISAAFGDSAIDMFSVNDLAFLVPSIFDDRKLYSNFNIRVSAEKLTMYEVASIFSDVFGKDVVYNPLTTNEMSAFTIPSAPAMAQMCQFLSSPLSSHDIEVTEAVMFPRKPQLFKDWLLTHSDHHAFEEVGLTVDASPILVVTVFGATGRQGTSVIKGLLGDKRKRYTIRATSRNIQSKAALRVKELDPERITLVQADLNDIDSCVTALEGSDGAFLVTDYMENAQKVDPDIEEAHAKNVIDACESCTSVKHLVFSTLESVEDMNKHYKLGLPLVEHGGGGGEGFDGERSMSVIPFFDAKARAATYARAKKISCTYVLMPVYHEDFFELMLPEERFDEEGNRSLVIDIPKEKESTSLLCMSVDELGPAVANIFDSYQLYAGHEVGLVTDFVTIEEVAEIVSNTLKKEIDSEGNVTTVKIEKKDITVDKWVEKRETHAQDLGQMFKYFSKTDAVKRRRSTAKALHLLPDTQGIGDWLEKNKLNASFREKLGLR